MAAGGVNTGQDPTGAEIDTDAFKQLYPLQFHERFFEAGLRPDGRTLGRARALTIGLDSVTSALGSCLAKLGATTVLAGVRAHVGEVPEGQSNEGTLKLSVELAPFATADTRGNVAQELLATLTQRLHSIILPLALHKQLGISEGKAAFHVQLDAYVLNADGAVFDALLLAVVAALQDTRLPLVQQDAEGKVTEVARGTAASQGLTGQRFKLSHLPVAVTCALVGRHLLVDPTHEEEAVQDSSVCVVLDGKGSIHGMYKSGGTVSAPPMTFLKCIEAAKLRYKEVEQQLVLMLQTADASRSVASTAMQE